MLATSDTKMNRALNLKPSAFQWGRQNTNRQWLVEELREV